MAARIGWRWEDPVEGTVVIMPINPNAGASPKFQKSLSKKTTTAPGSLGQALIFEGADEPSQFDFSGVLLTEQHYNFILNAWRKRHPVRLTDDLGRTFTIYLESFTPERQRNNTYPWKHTYQATAVIVE
jgi:hypothetical protein